MYELFVRLFPLTPAGELGKILLLPPERDAAEAAGAAAP